MESASDIFYKLFYNEEIYVCREDLKVNNASLSRDEKLRETDKNSNAKVLILFYETQSHKLIPKEELVLRNILRAIKISWEDIHLVNTFMHRDANLEEILNQHPAKWILAINIPDSLKSQLEQSQVKWIFLPTSLTELAMDRELKILLWKQLQKMLR